MKKIFLMMIGLGTLICADFSRSDEGVVTDSKTTLEWQDDYSDNGDAVKLAAWQGAIGYCTSLPLDGGNWRLPNKNELVSLVDDTASFPAIYSEFQNTVGAVLKYYWTSTTFADNAVYAWTADFSRGGQEIRPKTEDHEVRCVRGGK